MTYQTTSAEGVHYTGFSVGDARRSANRILRSNPSIPEAVVVALDDSLNPLWSETFVQGSGDAQTMGVEVFS